MARTPVTLAAVALALLCPSAACAADWLPVEEVGRIQPSDQQMRLAANDRGDAVVLWKDSRGIQAAVSRRGGAFGKPLKVPGSAGAWFGDVILNEDGRAIVYWQEAVDDSRFRVYLAGLKVDGGFGKARAVTPADPNVTFDPAIGPGGRFAFVYTLGQSSRPAYARVAPPSGKLGPRITLATGSIGPCQVWYAGNRPMVDYVQASDDWGTVRERQIGRGGTRVVATGPGCPMMDTASNGAQVAAWMPGDTEGPASPILASVRRPGHVFGKAQQLDFRTRPQVAAVAVAPSGAATVAWREWNEPAEEGEPSPTPQYTPGNIITAYRPAGGSFGATRSFRPDAENARIEGLAADIDSTGTAVLSWNGTRFAGIQRRLYTAVQVAGGEPEVTPMTDFTNLFFAYHRAEIDEKGRAVFGWVDGRDVLAQRGTAR